MHPTVLATRKARALERLVEQSTTLVLRHELAPALLERLQPQGIREPQVLEMLRLEALADLVTELAGKAPAREPEPEPETVSVVTPEPKPEPVLPLPVESLPAPVIEPEIVLPAAVEPAPMKIEDLPVPVPLDEEPPAPKTKKPRTTRRAAGTGKRKTSKKKSA